MQPLYGRIRDYAWGSRTVLAALQGRPVPSPGPEAELWLGAHPAAPATLPSGPLPEALRADPEPLLGPAVIEEFGTRLPYLLKVLAADAPLSIQAHPDAVRAAERHAAGYCGYTDPYHKPELLVALDDFEALCGFRPPEQSARLLESLGIEALKPVVAALRTGTVQRRLRDAVAMVLHWPVAERAELVAAVAAAEPFAARLAEHYPGDVGVVVAMLLNRVRLARDEAVWMPAGNLHAYLRGTGVEIMAASDNVLRGGLTRKPMDVPELLRVLRFEVLAEPVVRPVPAGPGLLTWPVPVREFTLYKATVAGEPMTLPAGGPRIVLCLDGAVELETDGGRLAVARGAAAFAAAAQGPVRCTGRGVVFQAGPGGSTRRADFQG